MSFDLISFGMGWVLGAVVGVVGSFWWASKHPKQAATVTADINLASQAASGLGQQATKK